MHLQEAIEEETNRWIFREFCGYPSGDI